MRSRWIGLAAAFFGTALLTSAEHPPTLLYEIRGERPQDFPGAGLFNAGDQNRDGLDDFFAVTIIQGDPWTFRHARIYDGRNGEVLIDLPVPAGTSESFGSWFHLDFALLDDINGDGLSDFAVVDNRQKFVVIYSGGGIMRTHSGMGGLIVVRSLGDLDGDGAGDYSIGSGIGTRVVNGYSGVTGEILWGYDHPLDGSELPQYRPLGPVGDVDGDTVPDLAFAWNPREFEASMIIFSGSALKGKIDIEALFRESTLGKFDIPGNSMGRRLPVDDFRLVDDLDGDTYRDIVVTVVPQGWELRAISGFPDASGTLPLIYRSPELASRFRPERVAVIGDLEGDGINDLLVFGRSDGIIELVSSKTREVRHNWTASQEFPFSGLGDEGAVLSDMDGDGWREVALYEREPLVRTEPAEPGSGRIAVFSLGPGGSVPVGFAVQRDGGDVVLTWDEGLNDVSLEASPDLVRWRAVSSDLIGNRYVVPSGGPSKLFYRLRFTP